MTGRASGGRRMPNAAIADLMELERVRDHDQFIVVLRERLAADRRVLTNARVKQWLGRRWRDLFLVEAITDEKALAVASVRRRNDARSDRQKIAERFLAHDIEDWRLELPAARRAGRKKQSVVYSPSFVHSGIPLIGFADEFPVVAQRHSLSVVRADSHGIRGAGANAVNLLDAAVRGIGSDAAGVPIAKPRKPGDVVLFGYSKGATDAYVFQGLHLDVAPQLRAVVNWAGCIGGTPFVDDLYRVLAPLPMTLGPGRAAILPILKAALPLANLDGLLERRDEFDLKAALLDLTTAERKRFAAEYAEAIDDTDVPVFNVAGAVSPLEVPHFQAQAAISLGRKCGANDMQLAVEHAQSHQPMSTTLGVVRAHHWDIALGPFPRSHRLGSSKLDNKFPRQAALAATFVLLNELGLSG
ncbi:hypothetical protein [Nocardioides sp. WS12]|uniref:hypothetical protein n=1 Tax=Nocardioides sp. WS12 TaxID=2486272 RepID=UPI0015FD8E62|nr:hypothetical protein [Nocardioides sp. WS12]